MSNMGWEKGIKEENLQKQKTRREDKDRNWEAGSSLNRFRRAPGRDTWDTTG